MTPDESPARELLAQLLDELRGLRADLAAAGAALHGQAAPSLTTSIELEHLPVVLRIDDLARIYRRGVETIRRELRQGIFRPLPFELHPYRWRRVDVIDDIERRPAEHVRRRRFGGRAAVRPKAKVTSPTE